MHFVEDVAEYDELGLMMKFKLNPDYVPPEHSESEFDDIPQDQKSEEEDR